MKTELKLLLKSTRRNAFAESKVREALGLLDLLPDNCKCENIDEAIQKLHDSLDYFVGLYDG